MCWNWGVSIGFSIALLFGSLFLYKRTHFKIPGYERDPYSALIVLNLSIVQLLEFAMWLVVYPLDADPKDCPISNRIFTGFVYIFGVLLWPAIVNTFCIKTTQGDKTVFKFSLTFGIVYFILGIVDLIWTTLHPQDYPQAFTCATNGVKFLRWNVALSQSRILPNGYDWFLFSVFPFLFYKPVYVGWLIGSYLLGAFSLPYLFVVLGEAASFF